MKNIYFFTLLFFTSIIGFAQERDHNLIRTRIISREEMTVTGSFSFTLEVLAYDTCTLDSIRIINDGTFLNINFNGSLSKNQNISQPNFTLKNMLPGQVSTCVITINHATTNLPYYPEDMGFIICMHENTYSSKNYAGGKVYFTPYNSIEIWDKKDFKTQPRVWATKTNPAPARVFIPRTSIPVSTKPSNPQIQYDWQKYYQITRVAGLPYLIQMAAVHPDTIKFYKDKDSIEVWQGLHNGQLGKSWFGNDFTGTVTGRLRANYVPDGQNNAINIGLEGVLIMALDNDDWYDDVLAKAHTDANGYFSLSYDRWQSPIEGGEIELVVQYWSENLDYDIEVEIDPYWSWTPVLFNVAPETDHTWIGDVGTSYYRNLGDIGVEGVYDGAFKTLNWAYKAYKFSKDNLGSLSGDLTRSLDILTESNLDDGTSAIFREFYGNRINLARNSDLHEGTIWHEFGHFLQYRLQNGHKPDNTGGDYDRWGDAHINQAWREGWADGFAMMCDVHYRYYDNESASRRTGFFNNPVNFEERVLVNPTNGFKSVYQIGCTILDLYDGPNKYQNLPNIAPTTYNDASTANGYGSVTPTEQDEVSLSFETICKAMVLKDNVGQFYIALKDLQTDICIVKNIQRVFTLNGITNPVNSYFNATQQLNSDILYTTAQTDGANFNMDIENISGNNVSYNFGAPAPNVSMVITDNLTISNGAKLSFNGNGNTGFGTGLPAFNNSTLNVQICSRALTINNSCSLTIGGTNLVAIVSVKGGIAPILRTGSTLDIKNNSSLTIESGARLIFEKGAKINLAGPNSLLIIKAGGKIQIGQDAIFTYTGDGFIRLETGTSTTSANAFEAIGSNAQVKIIGGALGITSKKVLEITGSGIVNDVNNVAPAFNLAGFSIQNAHITLAANANLNIIGTNTKCDFRFMDIRAIIPNDINNRHRGITVNGQYGNMFYKVNVNDAKTGITSRNFYGGGDIDILQVNATRCGTGVFVQGKGARIQEVNINACDVGIWLVGMDRSTRIHNPILFNNKTSVYAINCANNVIEVYKPHIHSSIYGLFADNSRFSVQCGIVKNNSASVTNSQGKYDGANVYLKNNSNFIADPVMRVGSGKTDISNWRSIAIQQNGAAYGPYIYQGSNSLFTDLDYSISGTLTPLRSVVPASRTYAPMPANNNLWGRTLGVSRTPINTVDYLTQYTNNPGSGTPMLNLNYLDPQPISAYTICSPPSGGGSGTGTGGGERMRGVIVGIVTPINELPNKPLPGGATLKDKIQEGYQYFFDMVPNHALAVENLTYALNNYNYDPNNFTQDDLNEWSIALMEVNAQLIEALSEGLAEENITKYNGENTGYSELVQGVISLQDKLLLDFTEDALNTFTISMNKATLLRMLDDRGGAIEIVNQISTTLYPELNAVKESFLCLAAKEQNLIDGTITAEQFEAIQCSNENFAALPDPFIDEELIIPGEGEGERNIAGKNGNQVIHPITVYPNPSKGIFGLKFKGEEATFYEIEVFDILGAKVATQNGMNLRENNVELNLSTLPSGTYFLRFVSNKEVQLKKLVITK